jgi:hypothetical protein
MRREQGLQHAKQRSIDFSQFSFENAQSPDEAVFASGGRAVATVDDRNVATVRKRRET